MLQSVSNSLQSIIPRSLPFYWEDDKRWLSVSMVFASLATITLNASFSFSVTTLFVITPTSLLVAVLAIAIFKFGTAGPALFRESKPLMKNYFPDEIFNKMSLVKKVPTEERSAFVRLGQQLVKFDKKDIDRNTLLEQLRLLPVGERELSVNLTLANGPDNDRLNWFQVLCHMPARDREAFIIECPKVKMNILRSCLDIPPPEVLDFLRCASLISALVNENLLSLPLKLLRDCPAAERKEFAVHLATYFHYESKRTRVVPENYIRQYIQSCAILFNHFDPIFRGEIDAFIYNLPAEERLPIVQAAAALFEVDKPRWSILETLRKINPNMRFKCASEVLNISELSWAAPFLEQIDSFSIKARLKYCAILCDIPENKRETFMSLVQEYLKDKPYAIQYKYMLWKFVSKWKKDKFR